MIGDLLQIGGEILGLFEGSSYSSDTFSDSTNKARNRYKLSNIGSDTGYKVINRDYFSGGLGMDSSDNDHLSTVRNILNNDEGMLGSDNTFLLAQTYLRLCQHRLDGTGGGEKASERFLELLRMIIWDRVFGSLNLVRAVKASQSMTGLQTQVEQQGGIELSPSSKLRQRSRLQALQVQSLRAQVQSLQDQAKLNNTSPRFKTPVRSTTVRVEPVRKKQPDFSDSLASLAATAVKKGSSFMDGAKQFWKDCKKTVSTAFTAKSLAVAVADPVADPVQTVAAVAVDPRDMLSGDNIPVADAFAVVNKNLSSLPVAVAVNEINPKPSAPPMGQVAVDGINPKPSAPPMEQVRVDDPWAGASAPRAEVFEDAGDKGQMKVSSGWPVQAQALTKEGPPYSRKVEERPVLSAPPPTAAAAAA